jgi:hypothetical protein
MVVVFGGGIRCPRRVGDVLWEGRRRTDGAMIGREDSSEVGILVVVRACVRTFFWCWLSSGFVDCERG